MYHNTTNESPQAVIQFTKITGEQDLNCLRIIQDDFKDKPFNTHSLYLRYLHKHFQNAVLESSIRRSVNTLMRSGYIYQTGNKVMGGHGRNVLEYKLS